MQGLLRTRLVAVLATLATAAGLLVSAAVVATHAEAAVSDGVVSGLSHDPFGRIRYVYAEPGAVRLIGFAVDPDALTSNVALSPTLDGQQQPTAGVTSVARPDVTTYYHAGLTPAFDLTIPVPTGNHTLCLAAQNIGPGAWTVLGCVATPVGTQLTSAQLAQHSPRGGLMSVSLVRSATGGLFTLSGWATDPDFVQRRPTVTVSLDGRPVMSVYGKGTLATVPPGAGPNAAWTVPLSVGVGAHLACTSLINVGFGANTSLGCYAFDTRIGPMATPVPPATANAAALTEALKHIGQQYVWGATGPKTFDCSGLVVYSYGKQNVALPRTSEQQYAGARLIPASHVQPGDLVFTHDLSGDVYHVGIYVSPGKAFAAIDTQEGVNYQNIWDPSSTTYGSFTHI